MSETVTGAIGDDRPARPMAPQWLHCFTLALIFVMPGQLAHAVDPKHGPFIALADVVAVIVGGLFVLWALFAPAGGPAGLRGRLASLRWPPMPFWALLVVAILSVSNATSLSAAAMEIIQLGLYFGIVYMLFANVLATPERQRQAVRVLLAATSLAVLYALAQYVTASDPQKVMSLFQSRTAYSGFLTLVLPLFFGLTLWSELTWERYWSAALIVLGAVTILAPPLVWIVAAVVIVIGVTWSRPAIRLRVIGATILVMALSMSLLPLNRQVLRETVNPYEEGPVYKLMDTGGEGETPQGPLVKKRWIEWTPALAMLADHFVLGVGAGNYQDNIGQYYGFLPNVKKTEPDTNNLYLVMAASMGFAGLIAFVAYVGHFWWLAGNLWMHGQTPWDRALACGLYGACLALLVVNLFTSVFVRGTALAWALIFALVMAKHEETTA